MPQPQESNKSQTRFTVYIVESPSPVDLYQKRYEGEILQRALQLANIPSVHRLTVSMDAFETALGLGLLLHLSEGEVLPPILHISAHGNDEGLQLTSGEVVTWPRLRDLLMPINHALNGNLLICMSSCQGFYASCMALSEVKMPLARDIPFFGLVGHQGKPSWSDTAIAFASFYHLLTKGYYIDTAVRAMKIASGNDGFVEIMPIEAATAAYISKIKNVNMQSVLSSLVQIRSDAADSPLGKKLRPE